MANEFVAGDARVDPLPNVCRLCHLRALCRVDEQALVNEGEGA
ncbi:MAG TPA: hypothetical protein VET48_14240 [Steroidobacteraceae bacterium]|nr:hypothetical protein [Steroidobacteraceae bacterium]